MKTKLAACIVVIGTLLAPLVAHAADSDSDRSHPMTYVKDSVITTKVKAKLAAEKMASLAHIQVDTDRTGVVILSGNVRSKQDEEKAVAIARGTEGVTAVKSNLQVKKDD